MSRKCTMTTVIILLVDLTLMHLLFRTCRYQWPCHVGLDCHGRRIGRGRGRPRRFRTPRQTAPPCRAPRLTAPFFDCMNVRNYSEGYQKRKEYLKPYTSPDDSRLQVIYIVPQFTCADVCLGSQIVYYCTWYIPTSFYTVAGGRVSKLFGRLGEYSEEQ